MRLSEYMIKLSHDKKVELDDRLLYLYDTENHTYFTKVIFLSDVDEESAIYKFAGEEPFHAFEKINVIRAYTITNCMNVMMGLESLTENYAESEVE